jgi:hypothetical protein
MVGNFKRASDDRIRALLLQPEEITAYLHEDEDGEREGPDEPPPPCAYVDKAWHGIHFLLTGSAWEGPKPLDFIVRGGREVGEIDVGYGAARAFTSTEVEAIAAALRPLTREVLRDRFDPAEMSRLEIYPEIWGRPDEQQRTLEYLLGYYDSLRGFLDATATAREGIIVFFN